MCIAKVGWSSSASSIRIRIIRIIISIRIISSIRIIISADQDHQNYETSSEDSSPVRVISAVSCPSGLVALHTKVPQWEERPGFVL